MGINIKIYIYNILKSENVTYGIIQNIGQKRDWISISNQYNFTKRKEQKRFSSEEIDKLCKYFQNNNITTNEYDYFEKAICECDIKENVSHESIINSISRIYNHEIYTKKTSKYNFNS